MNASTPAAPSSKPARRTSAKGDELVRTADLNPYFRNPRVGNVPLIVESLRAHGQYKPLVVNRGTHTGRPNEVLAGNHLLRAGLEIGLDKMLVHWLDVDDDEAAAIVLVDNRASDKGGYDNVLLAELLEGVPTLDGTGYSEADLRRLLNGLGEGDEEGLTDPDAVPALPGGRRVKTKPGDVYLLGKHRLVCGDSQLVDTLRLATGGAEADALWTDPPYGVDYVGKTKDALTIANDGREGLPALLHNLFTAAKVVLRPGAPVYVAAPPGPDVLDFLVALRTTGFLVRQTLVWVKNAMVLGRSDYQYKHEPVILAEPVDGPVDPLELPDVSQAPADVSRETSEPAPGEPTLDEAGVTAVDGEPLQHEPLLYGFTPAAKGSGRLGRGGAQWYGDNKQTTVFEVPKPSASREHPTMKPTDLIVAQLRNSTVRGDLVLDLCGGSGSTLIAAHRLGLLAAIVEIEPAYCDVICRRWQEFSGVMPILESTGAPVDFVPKAA